MLMKRIKASVSLKFWQQRRDRLCEIGIAYANDTDLSVQASRNGFVDIVSLASVDADTVEAMCFDIRKLLAESI